MKRALDLFSGIGGWSLGLHRNGIETIAACEINDWKRKQYARHFPHVRLYEDIRELTAERLRRDGITTIDIVVGSPPCTDISTANTKGLGVDGEESKLYFEAIRVIDEVRPRWCALENSANLRARGSDRVLAALEKAGYSTWPCVVGAVHAGAPHRRLRSWLVGLRVDGRSISDAQGVGCRQGRSRRSDPSSAREQDELVARQAARSYTDQGNGRSRQQQEDDDRRQSERRTGGIRSNAVSVESNQEVDPDADSQRQHGIASNGEVVGWCGDARPNVADSTDGGGNGADSDSEGPSIGQGIGRHDDEELAAIERGFGLDWHDGPGALARSLRMLDGVSSGMAIGGGTRRRIVGELARARSAFGDAVAVPVVEAIIGAIIEADKEIDD